jgi:predicted methyltransferase
MRWIAATLSLVALLTSANLPLDAAHAADGDDMGTRQAIQQILDGDHRSERNRARDKERHPLDTLLFFGIRPSMTVVEIFPSSGWYTEILAPLLRGQGKYYAAGFDAASHTAFFRRSVEEFNSKLAQRPDLYDQVVVTELAPPAKTAIAPPGSADMVLTFRNVHNWMKDGAAEAVFAAMYTALKSGGILGVVEHRGPGDKPQDPRAGTGYVREDHVIDLAKKAGFVLLAKSDINANAKDSKDYPRGVWTLPPTFAAGDTDKAKYAAIGESDRMTLKFQKP